MKRIIFQMSISLDGRIEGPNREIDWHLVDDEFNDFAVDTLGAADALLMGRETYELMAAYWPNASGNHPIIKERMNATPKLVFSRTLRQVTWQNSRLATGSIAEEVLALQRAPGRGLLWVGGSELAASFLGLGLLDELRVILTPTLLGGGKSVFGDLSRRHRLRLLWTKTFESGSVVLAYEPSER